MTVVKMPQLGETVIEGTILKWLKQEGDEVALDEPLFEISTDKVDTEVPSSAAGVLVEDHGAGGRDGRGRHGARRDRRRWGGWRRSSGSCVAARCVEAPRSPRPRLRTRGATMLPPLRHHPLLRRRSTTGRRAGCRFDPGGRGAACGSGASEPDLVAARSEAGDGARHRPRAGERDRDGREDHQERRAGVRGVSGGRGAGRRRGDGTRAGRAARCGECARAGGRWRRSRRSPWGAPRRSCRSRTSASRSRST